MREMPYTIVVDGTTGAVEERTLGMYSAGQVLEPSLTKVSSNRTGPVCSVQLQRPLAGKSAAHLTFNASAPSLRIMAAVGYSSYFGYHRARDSGRVSFSPR